MGIALAVTVLLMVGLWVWIRWQKVNILHDSIPPMPEISMYPQAFAQALEKAHALAISTNPQTAASGLEELGRLFHANAFLPQARSCWMGLMAVHADDARWPYFIADLSRLEGDESEMVPWVERSLQLDPEYGPAWLKLGNLYFAAGELDRARECYERRLEWLPDDPYAQVALARIAMQQGDSHAAMRRLQQLTSNTSTLPTAHYLLERLLREQGDAEGADRQQWLGTAAGRFREAPDPRTDALSKWCYDVEHLLMLGSIDYQTHHGDKGRALFERAMQLNPQHPEPYESLGRLYLDEGKPEQALKILSKGASLPQAPASLYFRLSEAYRQLNRANEALEAARNGLLQEPNDPDLLKSVGSSLDALGRYDEAIAAFESVLSDGIHAAEAHLNIGLVHIHAGRKNEALEHLKKALELRPQYPLALAELGVLELDVWNLDQAEAYIRAFYDNYPGSARARELMAQLGVRKSMQAARTGDLDAAEQFCLEGLEIHPDSPDLNSVLGLLYAQQERFEQAVIRLESARRVRPSDSRIVVNLAQIHARLGRFDQARWVLTEGERVLMEQGKVNEARQVQRLRDQLPAAGSRR